MKKINPEAESYRFLFVLSAFLSLTIVYSWIKGSFNFYDWFLNIYPELIGAIVIYLILIFEDRILLKKNKNSNLNVINEPESKIVLGFWESVINQPTDVYIGRDKDEAASWTDLNAVDLFRKVLKNQDELSLKHYNSLDENINYSRTNIISIGGPRRNFISSEILKKLKGKTKYEFVCDDSVNYQIKNGAIDISDSPDKDYALFYYSKQKSNHWIIFAGLTRYSTIACLKTLLDENYIRDIALKLKENKSFVEVLFSFDILGEQRIHPIILDANYL